MSTEVMGRVAAAENALAEGRATGWPAPGTPYDQLIEMERTATRLTYMGGLPGQLMDIEFVRTRQILNGIPGSTARMRRQLLAARQELVAARLTETDTERRLVVHALLDIRALRPTLQVAPERYGVQASGIVQALKQGWQIRLVPEATIHQHMPPDTYDMILAGDPAAPDAVYREASANVEPHESWSDNPASLAQAARVYEQLQTNALDSRATEVFFGHLAMLR